MNRSISAPSVELARSPARKAKGADGESLVWNLVAYSGEWRGHGDREFSLTREIFEQCVANLRAHPRYTRDWQNDLIPWDAGHLSEQPPELQPPAGPAVLGWVRDFEIRSANGRDELWALSRFTDEGRRQIRDEGRFASIAIVFGARDIVSGADIGATITSIALTPTPALADQPMLIAASRGTNIQKETMNPDLLDQIQTCAGRNGVERAVSYLRARSPGYSQLPWPEQWKAACLLLVNAREQTERVKRDEPEPVRIDISGYPGRNKFEKARSYLSAHSPGFEALSYDEQFVRAAELAKQNGVKGY